MPNYSCHKHHLHWFDPHYLTKASCKIAASSFKDFLGKSRKSKETHKLCIIMLINPFLHVLENIIFDFQITIDKVHPVQISSRSDNCITTDIM